MKRCSVEDESSQHQSGQHKRLCARPQLLGDLSDELILLILSSLSAQDLCSTQLLDRRFANLAKDQILWQHLYRAQYLLPSDDNSSANIIRKRRSKRSLGLISEDDRVKRVAIDWKKRYQIRSNWTRGRCRITAAKSSTTTARNINSHSVAIADSNLLIDDERCGIPGLLNLDNIFEITNSTLLVVTSECLVLYDIQAKKDLHRVPINGLQNCKYQDGFLALLNERNTLMVFHIEDVINPVITLKGSLDNHVQLQLRHFEDNLVVGLVYLDRGILDSSLRLQEVVISKCTFSVLETRVATSATVPTARTCLTIIRESGNTVQDQIVYHHPYLLVPMANHINLYTVHSSPANLVINGPQVLWGYGSTISSCQVQRALRFVVGSGDAGLKLWDLYSASGKNDVIIEQLGSTLSKRLPSNSRDLFDSSTEKTNTGIITAVSQELVISTNDAGFTTTHDFTI